MQDLIRNNKKGIIIITILLVLIIGLKIFINLSNKKNNVISFYVSNIDKNNINITDCDIEHILKYNNIPYFNLSNNTYDEINKEILTNFLLRTCYQDGSMDYEASLNDNILSVALQISYETDDDLAYLEYKTYNVDISNNTRVNNDVILNKYNLTLSNAESIVLAKFQEYYQYEKKMGYLNNESFKDYLNILKYTPITIQNMNLYIDKSNDLYLYKDYTLSEGMSIDEDFPYITVKFKLN